MGMLLKIHQALSHVIGDESDSALIMITAVDDAETGMMHTKLMLGLAALLEGPYG